MAIRPFRDEPDIQSHQGFLLSEDEALKKYLTGITVPGRDEGSTSDVGVWFRWPEGERQIRYPFVTIDLLQAEPAFNLFHSDHWETTAELYRPSVSPYLPEPPGGWATQAYAIRNYLPFRLMYQVVAHSRSALHDRYLQSIFRADVFPVRPFWIWNPMDSTWRRTELLQAAAQDLSETTESGTKRIFRKVYTVSMLAEVPQDRIIDSYVYKVLRVLIPVVHRDWFDQYHDSILKNQPTPMETFSQAERDLQGEYFHQIHEGEEVPTAI
jgi:hypothetical protein